MSRNEISEKKRGLPPVYNERSRLLILGSFPSVKSREIDFYYGHKQNRFWKTLFGYFDEEVPKTTVEKKAFLLRNGIALWDMVTACEIEGSSDSSIKNTEIADLERIFQAANIQKILFNGVLAEKIFNEHYQTVQIPRERMPSTSPANPRFDEEAWKRAFHEIFGEPKGEK